MKQEMELLDKCIRELGLLQPPVALIDTIGVPIYNVRSDLIALYKILDQKVKEEEDDNAKAAEPVSEDVQESDPE